MEKIPQRDYWPTHGWRSSTPREQGMNPDILSGIGQYLRETRPHLNTFLVIRHGDIVYQYYASEYHPDRYQKFHSMTKSVIATLFGIALQQGLLQSLDQRWEELLPEYFTPDTDARKKQITVRHLLKMSSGLNPDFLAYPGHSKEEIKDWVQYAIDIPLRAQHPDQFFLYSSLSSHLLSVILSRITGMDTLSFASKQLFRPLGIACSEQEGFSWLTDPQGHYLGGTGLSLTAPDAAKIGYLYLNKGLWNGTQILPRWYANEATQDHTGGGHPEAAGYGYQWWVAEQEGYHSFYAAGYGGQYIQVFPELDTMIIMFAPDTPAIGLYHRMFIPALFVIPSIRNT